MPKRPTRISTDYLDRSQGFQLQPNQTSRIEKSAPSIAPIGFRSDEAHAIVGAASS